ncbi:TPA: hypothetical protein L6B33_14540 [Pseudomonas aeruginosa]|nr:hypothetical protein U769_01305 [Pseudomonas aeruginosa MTB-1]AZZ15199.1 hypothetical protein CEK59_27410 [Pseudomonas aeruginosa]ETD53732.1 hypothetical protein X922_05445 [Pseudomonas aeruginosa VRFPA08]KSF25987.1 hypothetical protein AO935_04795 [Pseudomonas aeruginosa]OPD90905.1 hypothetical protein AO969_34800 [Pseudomonas aeruginosa]
MILEKRSGVSDDLLSRECGLVRDDATDLAHTHNRIGCGLILPVPVPEDVQRLQRHGVWNPNAESTIRR